MDSRDIEAQIKSLIGINLDQVPTGTLPLTQTKDSPGPTAPGAYPHRDRGGRKNNDRAEEKRSSGPGGTGGGGVGGRNKRPHRNSTKSSDNNYYMNYQQERDIIAKLQHEAQLEAEAIRQNREADFKPSDEILKFLAGKFIHPLKQRSSKFPRAKWFCRLCEYHCDNLAKCLEHFTESRHQRLTRNKELDETLTHLPGPNRNHLDCLNALLVSVEKDQGLSHNDISSRQAVASVVHNLLQQHLPGSSVRLYGSSWSGFGLKTANINLDLQIPSDHKPHLALLKALEILNSCQEFHSVTDEFTSKIPTIKFSTHNNMSCELSLNNFHAFQTSSLLRDYWQLDSRVRTLGVAFRYWASLVRLDRQAEGTLPPHSFSILLVYFLQQQSPPVLPCIHDYLGANPEEIYNSPFENLKNWKTENKKSVAELWVELFSFFSIGFKSSELVVSIRKSGVLTNEEKQWKSKKLAIEDPFSSKRNLCRSIQTLSVYDYITDCLKTGFLYFGTIQTSSGPVISRIISTDQSRQHQEDDISLSDWTLESWLSRKGTIVTEREAIKATELVPRNMLNFRFDQEILTNGTVLALQCVVCGHEGHLASSCPEEQLPELSELPPIPPPYLKMLSNICEEVARDWEPQHQELRDRDRILNDLSGYIKKFWTKSELSLFGSSNNGFAFRHSDLDISLTFRDIHDVSSLDCIALIEELSEKVKRMSGVKNVVAITSAKVPIVKLYYPQVKIDADISLYNVLARENTRLLSLYSDLDPRCRILGYMVKLFAKVCDIGDASRGSLSSYAYILMMIFYLQKTQPPVLPVLQELHQGPKPENIVDGWNAWFCSDKSVIETWPGWGKNRWNVGDLWIGFLDFFSRSWDDKRLVVSIRQSRHLTKFEKMWISPCIAIEDPFELSHNLGAGISRKMNLYIKKAFINARNLFGTPIKYRPQGYHTIQDYFFDRDLLTDGAPPNDRGCRACGKIGHLVSDCPRKKAADDRKREMRENRDRMTDKRQEKSRAGNNNNADNQAQGNGVKHMEHDVNKSNAAPVKTDDKGKFESIDDQRDRVDNRSINQQLSVHQTLQYAREQHYLQQQAHQQQQQHLRDQQQQQRDQQQQQHERDQQKQQRDQQQHQHARDQQQQQRDQQQYARDQQQHQHVRDQQQHQYARDQQQQHQVARDPQKQQFQTQQQQQQSLQQLYHHQQLLEQARQSPMHQQLLERARQQQMMLEQLQHQQQVHAQQQHRQQQQKLAQEKSTPPRNSSQEFDLSAFASLAVGNTKPKVEMRGAITAEDLEASFHTETDVSTDDSEARSAPAPRLPPGFDGVRGPPPVNQAPFVREPQGGSDVLGVQSLANLANHPPTSSPLPMFGGPMMMPGIRYPPIAPFAAGGLPLTPTREPHQPPLGPMWPVGPGFLPGQTPLFNPPNFLQETRPEMFNPWLHFLDPRLPPPVSSSNPLPIPNVKSKPNSPELLLDEGSPLTPPNLHNFNFED